VTLGFLSLERTGERTTKEGVGANDVVTHNKEMVVALCDTQPVSAVKHNEGVFHQVLAERSEVSNHIMSGEGWTAKLGGRMMMPAERVHRLGPELRT